ncbi:MAG: hypothetical protein C0458_16215 [Methylobacterium sp.]|jgi:hypothetical protein|nr:hypothetical protein [Methylobacterium sp.]
MPSIGLCREPGSAQPMTDMPIACRALVAGECLASVTEAAQGARSGRGYCVRIRPGSFHPA